MAIITEMQTAWQEWKRGAEILIFFAVHFAVGVFVAMLPSIAIAEVSKWFIGDTSRDMIVFNYSWIFLSIALVPFMVGAAMEKWKELEEELENEEIWKGLEP